jgi:hypothetical protein
VSALGLQEEYGSEYGDFHRHAAKVVTRDRRQHLGALGNAFERDTLISVVPIQPHH